MYEIAYHKEDLSKYSFLVTGGAGFIGSHLVEYLFKYKAKHIRIVDNLITGNKNNIINFLSSNHIEFWEKDITDYNVCVEAVQGIDFVLHQAALGSVPRSIHNPIATNKANVDGFLNLLTAAKESHVKRLIFASSSSVYGNSTKMPRKEKELGTPLSPYAVSKIVDELYATVFQNLYGLNVIGLRYFNIFGPRQNPSGPYAALIPIFIQALLQRKQPTIHGDGLQSRDFTFVENAVQANIKALFADKKADGEVFNIATGIEISVNDLFELMKKIINVDIQPEYGDERKGDVKKSHADISKAQALLGYNPGISVENGLIKTIEWFKNQK